MATLEAIDENRLRADHSLNSLHSLPLPADICPQQWSSLSTGRFSEDSIQDLFLNRIPDVCESGFLTVSECQRLVDIIKTHEIGSYPIADIWPPVGTVGIAFNHVEDKGSYFSSVREAQSLQDRFRTEAGIDVLGRVCQKLREICAVPVRIAREGDIEYFAGLLRLVNRAAKLHADYGPFDAPGWEIGQISAQLTWNILLKDVDGGECIVHHRPWQGVTDDSFKNPPPDYGYSRHIVADRQSKSMKYKVGDLHLFNSR
ncbi:hypothetical protein LTR09_002629 [Extremus antarcticus]|uniref:Uncharacterized protein n=1 Tax=Extremus antarcticus TaxID=702011 RepID=A0AAJ0GG20_9PEZI|nr:hypothetical protein LTR09_002629 [Extremus antarcticus]